MEWLMSAFCDHSYNLEKSDKLILCGYERDKLQLKFWYTTPWKRGRCEPKYGRSGRHDEEVKRSF